MFINHFPQQLKQEQLAIEESGAIHLCPIFYGEGLDSLYEQK
jgi:hypothetical protein